MDKDKFLEKISSSSSLDKESLNKLYRAVLRAAQQDSVERDGEGFHLLEGTVKRTPTGVYIFTPNKQLQSLLDKEKGVLLKTEESRFLDLLKYAFEELD